MGDKFALQHQGRRYDVERGEPRGAAARGGGAPVGADRWYVTLNLAAVTSLDVEPGETRTALRARIHRWLDEHPQTLGPDGIWLGGG